MDSELVLEGYHAKYTPFQFFDCGPESVPVLFLRLNFYRMLDDSNTPFLFEVRPLAQDLALKIIREPVFLHEANRFPGIAFVIFRLTLGLDACPCRDRREHAGTGIPAGGR